MESSIKNKQTGIQAISKNDVHQICSGQVVLNLATAVKELVENSLDAGATVIEIRLKEYGSELVEVIDNGSGVDENNFQALNSCGTRLEFDHNGQIVNKKSCARQVGTTVSLQNLFSTLPVRQKEFHRNLRREFAKMAQLLYAYCLVSTGVKITCSNQPKKGGRTVVVSTQGSKTVRENVTCIFGAKQVQNLMDFQQKLPQETVLQEYGLPQSLATAEGPFELEGCISSCAHGQGRSSTDRQFFYVNSRPCEPTKVIKIVNEVYHQFNRHQYPFVFLNLKIARNCVDVNVTPDKRQVFLDQEKLLIATIKASLLHMYETVPSTYSFQNISPAPVPQTSPSSAVPTEGNLTSMFKKWSRTPTNESPESQTSPGIRKGVKRSLDSTRTENTSKSKMHCINQFFSPMRRKEEHENISQEDESFLDSSTTDKVICISDNKAECDQRVNVNTINVTEGQNDFEHTDVGSTNCEVSEEKSVQTHEYEVICRESEVNPETTITESSSESSITVLHENQSNCVTEKICETHDTEVLNDSAQDVVVTVDDETVDKLNRKFVYMSVSVEDIAQKIKLRKQNTENKDKQLLSVKFHAEIDPTKNQSAEQELRKEISKDMFAKMEILGQFNLGFIVTRLGSDLFIIDQHATDEKYNFEMLQLNTVLQNQRLVIPQKLELTAVNESILVENEAIFRKNGFDFIIDKTAEPTKQVQLTAIPVSRNWQFGKDDIDELIFMLQDSPHTLCRPSRVRAMFASRACRKSVMIGTALSKSDMRRLVDHMGEIEHPWNCPHGRPTMRHLVNLDLIHHG
ncbi:mismatch repair endonuclease PMS2 isoform X2 [Periplaneta americana]|uniref:mismatch repair endonuclease PMS2 isoform X2 n=1 Tax=Periplaneta americana TaxID=6978 RepID=UPI0037E990CB